MVSVDDLGKEIADAMREYTDEIVASVPDVLDAVAQEALADIKAKSPKKSGAYARGWAVKKQALKRGGVARVIYNKNRYQLTHLLEFGHANRDGGRTKAQPHIGEVYKAHADDFERRLVRVIGGR